MIRRLSIYQVFMLFLFQLIIVDFYSIDQIYDSVRVEYEYEVNHVFGLNSKYAEFSPVWYHTDLIFSSDREWDYNNYGESNWENNKNINLFKVKVNSFKIDSVVFEKPELFNNYLIGENHVGPIAFNGLNEAVLSEVKTLKNRK